MYLVSSGNMFEYNFYNIPKVIISVATQMGSFPLYFSLWCIIKSLSELLFFSLSNAVKKLI
ncbi:hypothetical protein BN179_3250004 [Clostridioides difficile T6]|nr:hypothetical protein BN179_3250004 [Clostridioides difficile T6]